MFSSSPFQLASFFDKNFYIKRDDLLSRDFSGNKARKFYHFLTHDFPCVKRVVSSGSNQSNAMYSLSVLAKMKEWEFVYICDHIPSFLKENPERIIKGYNQMKARFERKEALKNEIKNLSDKEKQALNLAKEGIDVVKCAELVTKAKAIGVELNEQD